MASDQRRGRLLADARDAGQAVRRVAAQQREVAVRAPRDAVAAPDLGLVDDQELGDAGQRIEHADVGIAHEREEIAVARHDLDGAPSPGGERRDHVLALESRRADHGEAERPEQPPPERLVGLDGVGLVGEPMRLVGRERRHAKSRPPVVVDGEGELLGAAVEEEAREHAEEAVDPSHRNRLGQRVERPVEKARVVDQQRHAGGGYHPRAAPRGRAGYGRVERSRSSIRSSSSS